MIPGVKYALPKKKYFNTILLNILVHSKQKIKTGEKHFTIETLR